MGQKSFNVENTRYGIPFIKPEKTTLWRLFREDAFLNGESHRNFGLPIVEEDYSQIPYPEARKEWDRLHPKHGKLYNAFMRLCSWVDSWALKKN